MASNTAPAPRPSGSRNPGLACIAGGLLTLAIQSGWSPGDVRSLAVMLIALIAAIGAAQSDSSAKS
jgi:hypothetical protein